MELFAGDEKGCKWVKGRILMRAVSEVSQSTGSI